MGDILLRYYLLCLLRFLVLTLLGTVLEFRHARARARLFNLTTYFTN